MFEFILRRKQKDLSDVILRKHFFGRILFHNTMTGRRSFRLDFAVRPNRHFLLIDKIKGTDYNGDILGYRVKHDKESDSLVLTYYKYQRKLFFYKWVQRKPDIIKRRDCCCSRDGEPLYLGFFEDTIRNRVDVCGQAVYLTKGSRQKVYSIASKPNLQHESDRITNRPFGARNEMLAFFDGPVGIYVDDYVYSSFTTEDYIARAFESGRNEIGLKQAVLCEWDDIEDIREDVKKDMVEIACSSYDAIEAYYDLSPVDVPLSYLHKVGDEFIMRFFMPVVMPSFNSTAQPEDIRLMEFRRVRMVSNVPSVSIGRDMFYSIPIGIDGDPKGTFLEYSIPIINEWLNIFHENDAGQRFFYAEKQYEYEHFINVEHCMFTAFCLAKYPLVEKVYNIAKKINHKKAKLFLHDAIIALQKEKDICSAMFGRCDMYKKNLNSILMIPKGFLESIVKDRDIEDLSFFIRRIKAMFDYSPETRQMFCRMNKEDYMDIINMLGKQYNIYSITRIFIQLTAIRGYDNWKAYLSFVVQLIKDGCENKYREYLETVRILNIPSAEMDWKLYKEEIDQAIDELSMPYYIIKNKKYLDRYTKKFEENRKTWEKFAYEGDKFFITYPKSPIDLVKEGVVLRHCVKSFISAAGDGLTNILFIRKKEQPNKPYFTLEVNGGRIRQCHGFANCDIDSPDGYGLEGFLLSYCAEKNITYYSGKEMLAVEDPVW